MSIKQRLISIWSKDITKASTVITVVLLAAYLIPTVLGTSQNPIYHRSGLTGVVKEGLLPGQGTIDPNDGFTAQALGRRAALSWLEGDVPYWNHYEGVGMPLAGGMQSAAFFPLTLLLRAHNGFIYMHFLLQLAAGIFMYMFLRRIKMRFTLAVLGGVLFALNGAFVWLTNAPFNPIAFLPMLMLGIEYAISRAERGRNGGWGLIAIAIALSLYAGFPETAFLNALFAYGWGLVRLFQIKKPYRVVLAKKAVAGGVAGVLLSAPIIVAFITYLAEAVTGGHEGGAYAYIALPLQTLPALIMPYIYGPVFGISNQEHSRILFLFWSNVGGYITASLLLTAIIGLYHKRPSGEKLYLAVCAAIVVLKIYGFKPIAFLINLVPGMNQIAFYRYSIPMLSFALIVLAMYGIAAMEKKKIDPRRALVPAVIMLSVIAALALYAKGFVGEQAKYYPDIKLTALASVAWAAATVVAITFAYYKPKLRTVIISTVLVVDAFVMFSIPYLSWPKTTPINYPAVNYLKENIGLNRFYTLGPFAPNYGSYFGVASINVNDLPLPEKWAHHIEDKLDSNAIALVFNGGARADPAGPSSLEEFGSNLAEFEKLSVRYLVTSKGQVNQEFAAQHNLQLATTEGSVEIWRLSGTKPYFEANGCIVGTDANKDELSVSCETPSELTRRELFMKGWRAEVNGQAVSIKTEQEIFQGVEVPEGKSTVKFFYAPPYIEWGYIAIIGGLVFLVVGNFETKRFQRFLRTARLK